MAVDGRRRAAGSVVMAVACPLFAAVSPRSAARARRRRVAQRARAPAPARRGSRDRTGPAGWPATSCSRRAGRSPCRSSRSLASRTRSAAWSGFQPMASPSTRSASAWRPVWMATTANWLASTATRAAAPVERLAVLEPRRHQPPALAQELAEPGELARLRVVQLGPLGPGAALLRVVDEPEPLQRLGAAARQRPGGEVAPPGGQEVGPGHADRHGHGGVDRGAAGQQLEHARQRRRAALLHHQLHRQRHLGEGQRRLLLRRQLGHGRVHLLEA